MPWWSVPDNPAEDVSSDTVGIVAATFDPNLDNWRERLEENLEGETLNVVGMLSYNSGDQDSLAEMIETLTDLLQDEKDLDIDSVDVGAERDAEVLSLESATIESDYEIG